MKIVRSLRLGSWKARIKRAFIYTSYDSSAYWRQRAIGQGQSRVLWTNEQYNLLFREEEAKILRECVIPLTDGAQVLDIGCGIGIVARILVDMNRRISVDAVDFSEMIQVARAENLADRINYFESSAEDYYDPNKRYGLIVSSACFSAIRDVQKMEQAVRNCCRMLSPNSGVLLMIDPFHSWNYLARVKYSSKQMIDFVEQQGLELIRKDGVLFWPFRDWLANSRYQGAQMKSRFMLGERLLSVFGRHTWADYKILIFRRG